MCVFTGFTGWINSQVKPVLSAVKYLRNSRGGGDKEGARSRNVNIRRFEMNTNVWESLQCWLTEHKLTLKI